MWLAKKLRIRQQSLSRMLSAKHDPRCSTMIEALKILGLSVRKDLPVNTYRLELLPLDPPEPIKHK